MNRDSFLSAKEAPLSVPVPEWNLTALLRVMTATERVEWAEQLTTDTDENARKYNAASLLVRCLCDESGNRLFKDDEAKMLAEQKSYLILDRLGKEALKLNEIGDHGADQKKSDSPAVASADSSTTLPPTSGEA